ncbi:hypothetical protein HU200_050279 [Digitaria exilis]|uniref:F-box domain-containing protein n=1 Tax=Digitaria exilis TaxID=1010633 RepID=A0A835EAJ3_9POAL|nr:hypothetical protein HU200_050279 [Digitaria exilis]
MRMERGTSSRTTDRYGSMEVLCDALMVEEILPRLSPKSLICLGSVSRRYNAIVVDPDFSARYWPRAGVFFQPLGATSNGQELRPLFLSSASGGGHPPATAADSMFGADLTFLPPASAREEAYLRRFGASGCAGSTDVVVHSAAGLLLCSRGRTLPVHYYVWNPVSGQWVALPELPCPSEEDSSDEHYVDVIRLPTGIGTSVWKHCCCIGERHGGGLRYALSNDSVFEVWDLQTKGGDSMWMLAHRVGIAQLLERNPEVACVRPLGFHPTDDVVFLGIPGAVAAYSIQNGTMSLHHLTHDCYLRSRDMFPYVHPPYLVQIPAIKNSILASHEQ